MKELLENKKSRAGLALGLWIIFIMMVLFFASCSSKDNKQKPEIIESDFTAVDSINNLLASDISYNIKVNDDDNSALFNVTYKDGMYEGYKETNDGIIKFKCDLNKCNKVLVDHEEELEEYFFKDDLDIFRMKDIINNLVKTGINSYEYTIGEKKYKVIIKDKKVESFTIDNLKNHSVTFSINYNQ